MAAQENRYEKRYAENESYWGKEPSEFCKQFVRTISDLGLDCAELSLIDLGCGEGGNALYLASRGISVTGLDLSPTGLRKTRLLAKEAGLVVKTIEASLYECVFKQEYDLFFSSGTVHYIPEEIRQRSFDYFKSRTSPRGLHAITTLVQKPFIEQAPDFEEQVTLFSSGELMSYYRDWEILHTVETIFDCNSGGQPHRHAANRIIARKP
ncbi:MAG: methyltransferase domain-containing protein [bacterium]|nr:methyltransferase domain-containing protein [bacterium]